jgi:hypothetical protein
MRDMGVDGGLVLLGCWGLISGKMDGGGVSDVPFAAATLAAYPLVSTMISKFQVH